MAAVVEVLTPTVPYICVPDSQGFSPAPIPLLCWIPMEDSFLYLGLSIERAYSLLESTKLAAVEHK